MKGIMLGNRYELLEKVGEGGMAEVYKAKCHLLNRFVAVKILKSQYLDDIEFVNKFKQEASSAASLSHSNIVSIYDIGSENNVNYIVMEFIDGKTLKQIINEKKALTPNDAIIIAIQIAKALDCAHKHNIIHRDVKPHNILITKEGVVKVTDFGIAKATSSVTITNSDKIIGSAHYFSPEQAKGNVVDCRTDIYSLGIVLYEMITGKLPYDGESPVSIAIKHIQEKVVPPIKVNPNISPSLNNIILKAIEKEPYKRYENVEEMLSDLQKIKQDPNAEIIINTPENEYTKIMKPITNYDHIPPEEEINDYYDDDEDISKNNNDNKKKKIVIGSLIATAVIIIGFLSAIFAFNRNPGNSTDKTGIVFVPDIIGKDKKEAQKLIEAENLKFVAITESSDKPAGIVIASHPEPGTKIDLSEEDEVRVVISSGSNVSKTPNLMEIDFGEAKEQLKIYNLKLGEVSYAFSDTVDEGKVCDQSPKPYTEIREDTSVDLVISKGSETETTTVPNLTDKNLDEAQELLNNAKLKIGNITRISTDNPEQDGIVSVQSIEPNKKVPENTSVDVSYYVYSYGSTVIVPNFKGKTVKEAKELAREYNLKIAVEGRNDFIIISQDKDPGTEVKENTRINLNSQPNP